ncbi:MAG: hypothetical protein BroJett007_27060 [Chloroflexota bacterium]|nr:MAG: hypothetical protein BroJett007_27060 [Chloroflexota bacterium]
MRLRLGAVLVTALTIGIALITLVGLLGTNIGPISAQIERFGITDFARLLLQFAAVTAAVAVLVGVVNLLGVHLRRTRRRGQAIYSAVLILSFVIVLGFGILPRDNEARAAVDGVQIALETAFSGLVLFSLVYGAVTIANRRPSWASLLFVVTVVTVLVGALPVRGLGPIATVADWLNRVPVDAGGRAILLGIALATVIAGVRVLIGQGRATRE